MNLIINKEVIQRLKFAEFYPDEMMSSYFALMALHCGHIEELDYVDDFNSSRRAIMIYYNLLDKGYWKESPNPPLNFVETEKGNLFCEELISLTFISIPIPKIVESSAEGWIQTWLELFPKGVKSGGKLLRSDKIGCLKKMNKFLKDYKYNTDEIFEATEHYINEKERDGFKYCKCATYFISKEKEGSELAAQIESLKESDETKTNILYTVDNGLI